MNSLCQNVNIIIIIIIILKLYILIHNFFLNLKYKFLLSIIFKTANSNQKSEKEVSRWRIAASI